MGAISQANALLASLSAHLRTARPETRAIAIDWTAWADIGMATRGSIPALMHQAGIETLPPQVGIPTVRRELVQLVRDGKLELPAVQVRPLAQAEEALRDLEAGRIIGRVVLDTSVPAA